MGNPKEIMQQNSAIDLIILCPFAKITIFGGHSQNGDTNKNPMMARIDRMSQGKINKILEELSFSLERMI